MAYNPESNGVQGYILSQTGITTGSVITHVGECPTPSLDALFAALHRLPEGVQTTMTVFNVNANKVSAKTVIQVDRHWHPCRLLARDAITGQWVDETQATLQRLPAEAPQAAFTPKTLQPRTWVFASAQKKLASWFF